MSKLETGGYQPQPRDIQAQANPPHGGSSIQPNPTHDLGAYGINSLPGVCRLAEAILAACQGSLPNDKPYSISGAKNLISLCPKCHAEVEPGQAHCHNCGIYLGAS